MRGAPVQCLDGLDTCWINRRAVSLACELDLASILYPKLYNTPKVVLPHD